MICTTPRTTRGRRIRASAKGAVFGRSRRVDSLLLAIVLSMLTAGSDVRAAAPELMSYQGVLTDEDGRVVENGLYGLTFRIFGTATSGTAVWTQTLSVQVEDGLYNVILSQPGLATAIAPAPRFLEVRINSGPGIASAVTLAPRQQLSSVPYALRAVEADKTTPGPWIPLALQNGWVPFGQGGWPGPSYSIDGAGNVQLRGLVKEGETAIHTTILVLPAGARPDSRRLYSIVTAAPGFERSGSVEVNTGGAVVARSVENYFLSLDGISFKRAEP